MDIFEEKNIKPMLIAENVAPFDSPDWLYELKGDGVRAVAYLDKDGLELRNKRNFTLTHLFPELTQVHMQAKDRCILDCELVVLRGGKTSFEDIQSRVITTDTFKAKIKAGQYPASLIAFDILYGGGEQFTSLPLLERKEILRKTVTDSQRLAVAPYIMERGIDFFELVKGKGMEGIVGKKIDSKYYFGKETKDWKKIKALQDDDFVVLGYIRKDKGMTSIVLGQYGKSGNMEYQGHVTLGVGGDNFRRIASHPKADAPPCPVPAGNENAIWIAPDFVCRVEFMYRSESGAMRQPVFRGLRDDKTAVECIRK